MASGVAINEEVVTEYQNIKSGHKYKYVIYRVADNNKEIIVHKTEPNKDASYQEFCDQLPEHDCRYCVLDYSYTLPDGGDRNKLVFVSWCPDTAPIKKKMLYASSKDALRKKLVGIGVEIQATDQSEVSEETIKDKASRGGAS